MELREQEMEADLFVWEASVEVAAEQAEEGRQVAMTALRSTALDALDVLEEAAPAADADAGAPAFAGLQIEVEMADVAHDALIAPEVSTPEPMAEVMAVAAEPGVPETGMPDDEYAAHCLALLNETYPDGISGLFGNGIAEGLFALVWGKGPISGNEEWTNVDHMLLDAVLMTLGEAGVDLGELWEDFTSRLVEKLYPDGITTEGLHTALAQNGPISGEAEWTELDFQAFDLVKSILWGEDFDGGRPDGSLALFNDVFPGGIAELFPDGYSDEAFDALLEGKGLISGQAEWTEADSILFQGLWQALRESGILPGGNDDGFEPMPIVIDDGLVYPMPIVIDDGVWLEGEPEHPIMVICDLLPPPEMAVSIPIENMALI